MTITLIIILITVAVSLYASEKLELKNQLMFNPYQVVHHNKVYKTITHAFIHADFMHLGINMYVLYSFGQILESIFTSRFGEMGSIYFIILYVGGIIFATVPSIIKHKDNPGYNSLGASGAVSAVLFSFIILNPSAQLDLFGVIPINAGLFGVLYIGYEMYQNKNGRSNIAHDAHILGALFGIIFTILLSPSFVIANFMEQIKYIF
ncbi:MAG: rhomboid family intramembrane serine protease [Flavobacteriales bacterium]|nr:rhomboid family intramembrane serine protease [Flavobacteriales bacterium]